MTKMSYMVKQLVMSQHWYHSHLFILTDFKAKNMYQQNVSCVCNIFHSNPNMLVRAYNIKISS